MVELLKAWCFKDVEKFIFLFFCFWLGLLFCRLFWSGFGEVVLVMECNLSCSWILFMSCMNHSSNGGLVQSFQVSEGMWREES